MASRKSSRRTSGPRTGLVVFERLVKAGIIRSDATVAEVVKQITDAETGGGAAEITVLFDSKKWFCVMPD